MFENARYMGIKAGNRYWDDIEINGERDESGDNVPFKQGDYWYPVIDLEEGRVLDWPQGVVADVHAKICDDGSYWLFDEDKNVIATIKDDYVPDGLCHGKDTQGYGDYIIMKIDGDGMIEDYKRDINGSEWDIALLDATIVQKDGCDMCKRLLEERNTLKAEVDRLKEEYE